MQKGHEKVERRVALVIRVAMPNRNLMLSPFFVFRNNIFTEVHLNFIFCFFCLIFIKFLKKAFYYHVVSGSLVYLLVISVA